MLLKVKETAGVELLLNNPVTKDASHLSVPVYVAAFNDSQVKVVTTGSIALTGDENYHRWT